MVTEYQDKEIDAVIIGAGPGGLAMAACLKHAGFSYVLLEKRNIAGGTYAVASQNISLLSPARMCLLPFSNKKLYQKNFRIGDYLEYLQHYIKEQELFVTYDSEVLEVNKQNTWYEVKTKELSYLAKRVIVSTGISSFPKKINYTTKIPVINALDLIHPENYRGKKVGVLGSGVTAVGAAYVLAKNGATVELHTKSQFQLVPTKILGIDVHYWGRIFEILPVSFFKDLCRGKLHSPSIDIGIKKQIKNGLVKVLREGSFSENLDLVVNATGYRYNLEILPKDIARDEWGRLKLHQNQSVSHPHLYVLGYHCARKIDSQYLRGLSHDAQMILKDGGFA